MAATGSAVRKAARVDHDGYFSSFWRRTFAHARRVGGWVRVGRTYTRVTASQLVCDIRHSHSRPSGRVRIQGIEPGEVWEARFEPHPNSDNGDQLVYIRLVTTGSPLVDERL